MKRRGRGEKREGGDILSPVNQYSYPKAGGREGRGGGGEDEGVRQKKKERKKNATGERRRNCVFVGRSTGAARRHMRRQKRYHAKNLCYKYLLPHPVASYSIVSDISVTLRQKSLLQIPVTASSGQLQFSLRYFCHSLKQSSITPVAIVSPETVIL